MMYWPQIAADTQQQHDGIVTMCDDIFRSPKIKSTVLSYYKTTK